MITEYHRPKTIQEALKLLARPGPTTWPLGGGSYLNQPSKESFAVVDLQGLGLDQTHDRGNFLEVGAAATLATLLDTPRLQPALTRAIRHETAHNLRQVGTVAGTLLAATGRSPFTTVFLALDARLTVLPGDETLDLGDLLPIRQEVLPGRLVTIVTIPLNADLAYEFVARSPADQPLVCVAAARWPSGRTRVALGGCGKAPLLAFDGTEADGAEIAARDAYHAAQDEWASAEYRREIAGILTRRCLAELQR
ncbi:MAG: FAD binding domain-containing protein [Anaerolineales bacterium]|jgi:CO/xanthine dehydrogenase FAD-binding subunit